MKRLRDLAGRYWPPLVFLVWLLALAWMLRGSAYTNFLRPEFGVLLALGGGTLIGFLVTRRGKAHAPPFGSPEVLRMMILVLPLVHLWNAQGATLGGFAFQNRSMIRGLRRPRSAPRAPGAKPDAAANAFSPEALAPADGPAIPVTLVDLYRGEEDYRGKRIRLLGMYQAGRAEIEAEFGKPYPILYRFVIACCAADATPASVLVVGDGLPTPENDTWVTVEGTFHLRVVGDYEIPMVIHATMKEADQPRIPYLF